MKLTKYKYKNNIKSSELFTERLYTKFGITNYYKQHMEHNYFIYSCLFDSLNCK